ncbi:hypothetical protein GCM10009741_11350 [Kribbella lupini]|uniref:Uncharacterized protein n=1 Tax=Kribbella lupini TaxID=291602 RepID=A0ABP4L5E6_9ACTN
MRACSTSAALPGSIPCQTFDAASPINGSPRRKAIRPSTDPVTETTTRGRPTTPVTPHLPWSPLLATQPACADTYYSLAPRAPDPLYRWGA